ncbi:MAG TPA: D-glycero-beta-D-manno-heptose 1,7-bisphosphate 7-phosphatase [Sedimentisphaerales bacterium]|nr:D-glycero-beta-D-manno-heptose 1,7-bisphosphate 7-phosphatase [Sedimentisphaerales bacterium]
MSDKAIFLDRDDTLIEDTGYINSPEQVKLLEGVAEALIELKALGYKLVVVTNQSAVARGIVTEKVLGEIHNRLEQLLAEKKAFLDGIYYCPYHPDGAVKKYRKESDFRKPNPGMLLKAAEEMDIDLGQSWCVGNSISDMEAGLHAGCKTILIDLPSHQQRLEPGQPRPDYKAVNIKEVVNIIKKHHRSSAEVEVQAQSAPTVQTERIRQATEQIPEAVEPASQATEQIPEAVEPASHATEQIPEVVEPASQATEQIPEVVEPVSQTTEQTPEFAEPVSQIEEQQLQSALQEPQTQSREEDITGDRTEQLLNSILKHLKSMQRTDMFGEFSIMRLMAGIIQILVLFCLLMTIWFLMSPNRQDNSVFIALGFAMVLQLMSLTFYIMQGKK